jgi:hypothetical protein
VPSPTHTGVVANVTRASLLWMRWRCCHRGAGIVTLVALVSSPMLLGRRCCCCADIVAFGVITNVPWVLSPILHGHHCQLTQASLSTSHGHQRRQYAGFVILLIWLPLLQWRPCSCRISLVARALPTSWRGRCCQPCMASLPTLLECCCRCCTDVVTLKSHGCHCVDAPALLPPWCWCLCQR